jgi:hypothetical protein
VPAIVPITIPAIEPLDIQLQREVLLDWRARRGGWGGVRFVGRVLRS